jgi:hypothetical protein
MTVTVDPVSARLAAVVAAWDRDGSWRAAAACAPLVASGAMSVDDWFPERGQSIDALLAICGRCSVRVPCREYAIRAYERDGVWGGTSGNERRRIRKEQRMDDDDLVTDAEAAALQAEIEAADMLAAHPELAVEPETDEARERREWLAISTSAENAAEIARYREVYGWPDWPEHFNKRDLDIDPGDLP